MENFASPKRRKLQRNGGEHQVITNKNRASPLRRKPSPGIGNPVFQIFLSMIIPLLQERYGVCFYYFTVS